MQYVFDENHPFLREIMVHTLAVLGFTAVVDLGRTRETVKQLENIINREKRLPTEITFPLDFPPRVRGAGCVADSVLLNAQDIALGIQSSVSISIIHYEDADATAPVPPSRWQQPGSLHYKPPPGYLHLAAQVSAGSAYEAIKDEIGNAYGPDPTSWPKVLEYFRHVRNGCFHKNRFDGRPPRGKRTAIDASNPPRWRISVMPDDASMNSRAVFGDFLDVGDCPILLGDVANQLRYDGVVT